jgi:hypothetical protein
MVQKFNNTMRIASESPLMEAFPTKLAMLAVVLPHPWSA